MSVLRQTPAFEEKVEQTLTEAGVRCDSEGRPLNPRGRTGMVGRGLLGKFGPNHAADPIVTRFHPRTDQLQFVASRRTDTGDWAIPGGMVDAGEICSLTMRREFEEEATRQQISHKEAPIEIRREQKELLDELFDSGRQVYCGCALTRSLSML